MGGRVVLFYTTAYEPPSVEYDKWHPIDRGVWSFADLRSDDAQSRLASTLVTRMRDFGNNSRDDDIKRAEELATQAVAISPRSAPARFTKVMCCGCRAD